MAAGFVAAVFLTACTDVLGQLVETPGDRWASVLPGSVVHDVDRHGTPRARATLQWIRGAWGRQAVEVLRCGHPAGTLAPLGQPQAAKPWRRGGTDSTSRIADVICSGHPAVPPPAPSWQGAAA
jgi:hypothetical protein